MTEIKTNYIKGEPTSNTLKKLELEVCSLSSAACLYRAQALVEPNPEQRELYIQGQKDLEKWASKSYDTYQKMKTDGHLL